jgi:hypothetical protein
METLYQKSSIVVTSRSIVAVSDFEIIPKQLIIL